jgi:hypothetical protein
MDDEYDKEPYFLYEWTSYHNHARKQAVAELVRCGVLRDEYAGASELAIHQRPGRVKGADDELSILLPTTREVHLIYLEGGGLDKGIWVGWSIHSILVLNRSIVV